MQQSNKKYISYHIIWVLLQCGDSATFTPVLV